MNDNMVKQLEGLTEQWFLVKELAAKVENIKNVQLENKNTTLENQPLAFQQEIMRCYEIKQQIMKQQQTIDEAIEIEKNNTTKEEPEKNELIKQIVSTLEEAEESDPSSDDIDLSDIQPQKVVSLEEAIAYGPKVLEEFDDFLRQKKNEMEEQPLVFQPKLIDEHDDLLHLLPDEYPGYEQNQVMNKGHQVMHGDQMLTFQNSRKSPQYFDQQRFQQKKEMPNDEKLTRKSPQYFDQQRFQQKKEMPNDEKLILKEKWMGPLIMEIMLKRWQYKEQMRQETLKKQKEENGRIIPINEKIMMLCTQMDDILKKYTLFSVTAHSNLIIIVNDKDKPEVLVYGFSSYKDGQYPIWTYQWFINKQNNGGPETIINEFDTTQGMEPLPNQGQLGIAISPLDAQLLRGAITLVKNKLREDNKFKDQNAFVLRY